MPPKTEQITIYCNKVFGRNGADSKNVEKLSIIDGTLVEFWKIGVHFHKVRIEPAVGKIILISNKFTVSFIEETSWDFSHG